MAKDWTPVRAVICRYYEEGRSLREVREALGAENNFHASYDTCLNPTDGRLHDLALVHIA